MHSQNNQSNMRFLHLGPFHFLYSYVAEPYNDPVHESITDAHQPFLPGIWRVSRYAGQV